MSGRRERDEQRSRRVKAVNGQQAVRAWARMQQDEPLEIVEDVNTSRSQISETANLPPRSIRSRSPMLTELMKTRSLYR